MIRFSNGHELTFACASGALAFDGRGWWFEQPFRWLGLLDPKAFTVVAKTVTYNPVEGNYNPWSPWTCIRYVKKGIKRGLVNAFGLTNMGLYKWISDCYPVAKRKGYTIAASIKPMTCLYAQIMRGELDKLDLAYVEVNISCPNIHSTADVNANIRHVLGHLQGKHPLVLKLSYDQVTQEFVKETEDYVEAYHAINTIPWDHVFPDEKSPIEDYPHKMKGGVSGDFTREKAQEAVAKLKEWTDRPIIGGSGIFCIDHVREYERKGASAFSIGSCFPLSCLPLSSVTRPNRIVREYNRAR